MKPTTCEIAMSQRIEELEAENSRLRAVVLRDTKYRIAALVDWLNADDENGALLLSAMTAEQINAARDIFEAKL